MSLGSATLFSWWLYEKSSYSIPEFFPSVEYFIALDVGKTSVIKRQLNRNKMKLI